MVPGLNSNVERKGTVFHVQTEDLGRKKPIIQTLVYHAGEVVTVMEYTYEALATSEHNSAEEVRKKLEDQHRHLLREIVSGVFDCIDPSASPGATEEEIRKRERILDYLESELTYDREPWVVRQPVPTWSGTGGV